MDPRKVQPKNEFLDNENRRFMRDSYNNEAAAHNLQSEVERRGIKSRGELEDFARKHGYLKTDMDVKVFKHVVAKSGLKERTEYDRERQRKEEMNKAALAEAARESRNITKQDLHEMAEMMKSGHRFE